jgi:ABC-type Zn2+ transport system substrate-binding protein/surface adhesin
MYYAQAICRRVNPGVFGEETHEHEKHEHKHEHEHKKHEKHEKHKKEHEKKSKKLSKSGDPAPKNPAPASHWDRQKMYTQDWLSPSVTGEATPVAQVYSPAPMLKPLGYAVLAALGISGFAWTYKHVLR